MKWRIECKHSGAGHDIEGSFDEALDQAEKECTADWLRFVVWECPGNIRMAEVGRTGPLWVKQGLTGEEVTTLMRRHKTTIADLSFLMGITQKRIREVRSRGLEDPNAIRDWIEAITGEDVGPLPERYRIRRYTEEADCNYCGCPFYVGDTAYEYCQAVYCSITCSREHRKYKEEVDS